MSKSTLIATSRIQEPALPAIKVGLSACLAGHSVRYNGGHSQSKLCVKQLSNHFQFDTFCPEVAAGFGTPRPSLRLTGDPEDPTLSYTKDPNSDVTEQLKQGFAGKIQDCGHLDGYILMKNSPSCGLERIKVYRDNGYPMDARTSGLFAGALRERWPLLPLEEEGRLHDPVLRENFILRVYAHHHFRTEVLSNPGYHRLLQFHSTYKYVLMAHCQSTYRRLGRRLSGASKEPLELLLSEYQAQLMQALAKPAKRGSHCNVLLHLLGYLKQSVPAPARQHIAEIIHRYREGKLPLVTPMTLLRHYIDREGSEYVRAQRYWQPYPEELGLTNNL
jgi:uncharacterized protein YbgA (DUF1722 family)/uncharacterized protein YbbK (DUF523 family)